MASCFNNQIIKKEKEKRVFVRRFCLPLIWINIKFRKTDITLPFQEQLTKVATWGANTEVMRQVVTESGARVRKIWNGSGLQWKKNFYSEGCHMSMLRLDRSGSIFQYLYKEQYENCVCPNLCEDEFHQLLQQLFSSNPGIEHASYVFNIRVKGPWWGAQVAKKFFDHISQGCFIVIIFTVIISKVLYKNHNKNIKI